jgi:hypothetical protein
VIRLVASRAPVSAWLRRHAWALLGFAALFTTFRMARLEGWDDAFYLGQLLSLSGDRDLLLQDDLLALWNPFSTRLRSITEIADSGAVLNAFSVGPAVAHSSYLWPLLTAAPAGVPHGLRAALALGSMACLVLTVLAMRQLLRRLGFAEGTAHLAAGLAVAAGPLALYGTRVYLGSHLLTAFFAAFLFLAGLRWLDRGRLRDALLMGLAGGLLVITRWQDVLLLLALAPAAWSVLKAEDQDARRRWQGLALAGAAFALAVSCQLLAWRVQYDMWLMMPQGYGYMHWTRPAPAAFLLSTYHGVLPWAPAFALGLAAMPFTRLSSPHSRALRLGSAAALALVVYTCAAVWDWWGGESYGPRRLASLAPLAAVGLAGLLDRLPRWLRVAVALAIVGWAAFTMTALISGYDDLSVAFGGAPSRWHPTGVVSHPPWIDRLGEWPRMLRPGFSFSDRPRLGDRLLGLGATVAVFAAVTTGWRACARSVRLQRLAVVAGAAWLVVAAGFLALAVRPSGPAGTAWRTVVADGPLAVEALSAPGLADAARVVAATHALDRGDEERARSLLSSLAAPAAVHVTLLDLRSLLSDPAARRSLEELRSGRRLVRPGGP